MNTKRGLNLSGFLAVNPIAKYSDCAWSEAACTNNNHGSSTYAHNHLAAGGLNLMSRFSLNSSLTIHSSSSSSSAAGCDSDATSSSTSSNSNINNNSLSVSPSTEQRDTILRGSIIQTTTIKPPTKSHQQQTATAASNRLLALQKEIKEEEDEIFKDINSLINSRSNLYSNLDEDDDVDDGVNLDDDEINSTNAFCNYSNNNIHNLRDYNNHRNHHHTDEHLFATDSDDLNDYQSHSADDTNATITTITTHDYQNDSIGCRDGSEIITNARNEPNQRHHDHLHFHMNEDTDQTIDFIPQQQDDALYLHDQLEEDNHEDESNFATCNQTDQQNYEAIQAVIQQVTNNLPKPCVFFLEGNCRRSDCKYSHDLSNITCKYWIEGFCFKGELCPFLHSYTPASDPSDPNLSDEDGLKSLSKKKLDPTFVIESETDFPSLPLDAPATDSNGTTKCVIDPDAIANTIKHQILSSNPAVVFKTAKKKRKKG